MTGAHHSCKGFLHTTPEEAPGCGLFSGDFSFPLLVLKEAALDNNIRAMAAYAAHAGVLLAPHAKTTMCPEIFTRQLAAGAWGLTAATAAHVQVYLQHGVRRILVANQLADPAARRLVLNMHAGNARDVGNARERSLQVDIISFCDSAALAKALSADAVAVGGTFRLLLELGVQGGRTGVRGRAAGLALAREIAALPGLSLEGAAVYEGVIETGDPAENARRVTDLLEEFHALATELAAAGLFAPGPVILSAGGSAYYDLVAPVLARGLPGQETVPLLRSGCYVTHDDGWYRRFREVMTARGDEAVLPRLESALELWSTVQSTPEPGLAILSFGKRDAPYDIELPVPRWRQRGTEVRQGLPEGWRISRLNDQHAFLEYPSSATLDVGDRIGCGISHPCGAFDRWRCIPVVDAADIVRAVYHTVF